MHSNLLAILFALASALTIAWGTVVRHQIAQDAQIDEGFHSSPLWNALTNPRWWLGTGTAMLGYAFQVVALGFGALLVVQPILVLKLMFTLPLAAHMQGRVMSRSEVFWASLLTVAIGVLVLLGRPIPGDPHVPLIRWIWALSIGTVILSTAIWYANRITGSRRALILGLVTGATFGYVAVLSKAVVDNFTTHGVQGLLMGWETYALVLGATLGTIIQQYSFNAGALSNSLPAMTIGEPICAFQLGYLVLGERFQVSSAAGWIAMGVALVAMIAATTQLTKSSI